MMGSEQPHAWHDSMKMGMVEAQQQKHKQRQAITWLVSRRTGPPSSFGHFSSNLPVMSSSSSRTVSSSLLPGLFLWVVGCLVLVLLYLAATKPTARLYQYIFRLHHASHTSTTTTMRINLPSTACLWKQNIYSLGAIVYILLMQVHFSSWVRALVGWSMTGKVTTPSSRKQANTKYSYKFIIYSMILSSLWATE